MLSKHVWADWKAAFLVSSRINNGGRCERSLTSSPVAVETNKAVASVFCGDHQQQHLYCVWEGNMLGVNFRQKLHKSCTTEFCRKLIKVVKWVQKLWMRIVGLEKPAKLSRGSHVTPKRQKKLFNLVIMHFVNGFLWEHLVLQFTDTWFSLDSYNEYVCSNQCYGGSAKHI